MNGHFKDQFVARSIERLVKAEKTCTDPYNTTYPTAVQTSLISGALLSRFDSSGRFVAAARADGSTTIWDLDTKNAIRWLEGHVKAVTSIEYVVPTQLYDFSVLIYCYQLESKLALRVDIQ